MPFPRSLPQVPLATGAILLWVGLALVMENVVGHVGDQWSFRGWPFVWHSKSPNALREVSATCLLLDLAISGWGLWATARLCSLLFAARDWRFSLGSLLVFTAAVAITLAAVRASAADDALHASFPLRLLEPAHPWGFVWSQPGVAWVVNAALLMALLAGCWCGLQSALSLAGSLCWRASAASGPEG